MFQLYIIIIASFISSNKIILPMQVQIPSTILTNMTILSIVGWFLIVIGFEKSWMSIHCIHSAEIIEVKSPE